MSFSVEMSSGEEVRKKPCEQQEPEPLSQSQELLTKMKEYLEKRIDRELLNVKKNSRENRRVALQALRGKKWCEKHLTYIDCAVKAIRSTNEHIDILNKVNELLQDIREEGTQNMAHSLCTPVSFGVECDEDELLAELERLEKNLDETPLEMDRTEERVPFLAESSTASLSSADKMEEDEIEEELQYLWRWLNESS
ncbi:charged multivesicular body protein 4b-like [Acanthopagrus latus]|uniref:charged multivesicular body protein 4b-like n=1 Tax=Acanthopagrus latus TaxID=8177 RepID=UPI00187C637A|nr:charged multivesicular body protein 4b-like [Acanthopagrus latus]